MIFFFALKIALFIQFILIILKRQTRNSIVYIITEIIFKTALFAFIEWFTFHNNFGIHFEDKMIISFTGGLLFYDAWFNDFPNLLEQLRLRTKGKLPPWLDFFGKNIQQIKSYSDN